MAENKTRKIISADTGEEVVEGAKKKVQSAEAAAKKKITAAETTAKKKVTAAETTAKEAAENIEEAVETAAPKAAKIKEAKKTGSATGLRIGAILLFVAAIVFEVLAILIVFGKINLTFLPMIWQLIIMIVLDLACVIIGAQLWKKANHIDPASEKNKVKFWIWNNMGVIAAIVAFVPIIIIMLANKNLDKKTKVICTVVAVIALLIGGLTAYDWNPVSLEQKEAAVDVLGDTQVYWAPFGKVYHTSQDCSALNRSETLTVGTVEQAIAANRVRLCSFCAKRDSIEGVATDDFARDEIAETVDNAAEIAEGAATTDQAA
ncbi:MAG: hypothetical protein IKS19_00070 [Clostridia bacterium]|nr:hypothetical protein [Clostridia bacterium]